MNTPIHMGAAPDSDGLFDDIFALEWRPVAGPLARGMALGPSLHAPSPSPGDDARDTRFVGANAHIADELNESFLFRMGRSFGFPAED